MCAYNSNSNSIYTDIASAYWNEICDIKPLPQEEQLRLLELIKAGDREAYNTFIESFLRLVVSRAKKYCYDFDSFMDFVQDGNIGLMKAIECYDPNKSSFVTHATQWIDKYIRRESPRTGNPIHIPEYLRLDFNRMLNAEKLYEQTHGRAPSINELSDMLKISSTKIAELKNLLKPTLSLNQEKDDLDENNGSLIKTLADEESPSPEEITVSHDIKDVLNNLMKENLTETEYKILRMRFGFGNNGSPISLSVIANECGLSTEGVRKAEVRAVSKLQKVMLKSGLTRVDFLAE